MASYDGSLVFDTKIDKTGFEKGASSLKSIATKSAAVVGAALAGGIGSAVKVGMDFEAQMSKVGSITLANAEDMKILNDKAKEMGETTVFSASQAGQAFEYMSMAGWKTEDMVSGISGIMDLAAASGENLGTVSDIVTDALTAFGLTANDSGRFADVLAAASSNANTNVSMMGETFKYVAPVAGAMGYSIEDTAVTIGLMANSGIKASQAGTSLRQILLGLQGGAELTGKSFGTLKVNVENSDGSMRDLNDVVVDLRSAFSKMTAAEKAANAESIAGKIGMSGLLAIVNASENDFNKLTSAIENSSGTAKEMAERNLDNLKGQLTLAGSAAEGLGIAVYEGIEEPLKNAVKTGASKISELTKSFKDGELKPALDNVGKLLGNITNSTIDFATGALPVLIDGLSAVSMNLNFILPIAGMAASGIAAYKVSVGAAALAQTAFNTAVNLNPVGLTIAGIAAAGAGIYTIANACKEAEEAFYNFGDSIEEAGIKFDEVKEKATLTDDNAAQWYELKDAIASGKLPADEMAAAEQKVKDIEQWFIDNYGSFISAEEQKNGIRAETIGLIQNQAEALSETQRLELENQLLQNKSNIPEMIEEINKLEEKNQKLEEQEITARKNSNALLQMKNEYLDFLNTNPSDSEINDYLAEMSKRVEDLTGTGLSGAGFADLEQRIGDFSKSADKAAEEIEKNNEKMEDGKTSLQQYADGAKRIIELQLGSTYEQAAKKMELLKSAQDEFNSSGGISKKKLDELTAAFPELGEAKENPELITQKMQELEQKMQDARKKAQELGTDLEGLPKDLDINVNLKVNGTDNLPHNAKGTTFAKKGLSVVNEKGLELIEGRDGSFRYVNSNGSALTYLNRGDRVYTAQQTRDMLRGKTLKIPGFAGGLNNSGTSLGFNTGISGSISASSYNIGKMIDLGLAAGIEGNSACVIGAMNNLNGDMITAATAYNAEYARITAERNAADAESERQAYEEKLSKAKKSAEKKKIIAEQEAKDKKKADDEYLSNLKRAQEREFSTLKNSLDLGLITTDKYYESLTALRDKYFVEGTDDWEKYTLEIVKGYRDDAFKDLKNSLDMGYITEEQYYKDLEILRDQYFTQGSDEWNSYTLSILNYQKKQIKEAYADIEKYADNTIGKVVNSKEQMQSKLKDFGGLTQTVKINGLGEWDELADLEAQNKVLEDYVNSLSTLKEKLKNAGAGEDTIKGIMSEIEGMGIAEANKTLRAFNNTTGAKLANYVSLYAKKQELSESLSAGYYKEDYENAVDESIKYAEDKLKEFGFDVPKDFFTTGTDSAEQFGTAFADELDKQLSEIRTKIEGFNASLSYSISAGSGSISSYNQTTYNTTYNLENSGGTAEAGIAAAKRQEAIDRYRNG